MIDYSGFEWFLLGTWVPPLVFVAIKFLRSWRMAREERGHNDGAQHRTLLRVIEQLERLERHDRDAEGGGS